ncbi:MAG: hypothetical protein HQL87_13060 [Magnetococcales bacterium]|nr:hypothetical protein [Magnetococcales bacterium]
MTLQPDGMTVKASSAGVAVARIRFYTNPVAFGISSPAYMAAGIVDFSINVVIEVTAA